MNNKKRLMFYVVKIIFRVSREGERNAEFDEQFRLIEAEDSLQAYLKAKEFGKGEEEFITDIKSGKIFWQLVDVSEVQPLSEITSGTFLWSETKSTGSAEEYVTFVKARAAKYKAALQIVNSANATH